LPIPRFTLWWNVASSRSKNGAGPNRVRQQDGDGPPIHLHGHHFQVVEINRQVIQGALRDTVLVPPKGSVTVAFTADNPGRWHAQLPEPLPVDVDETPDLGARISVWLP
jgi:hypothetical protein